MADWVQKMKDTMQPHVPEPVVAVGILQPAGTWGAAGVGVLSPLAGKIRQRKANKASGDLARGALGFNPFKNVKMAMFALTADRLYAFSGKPRGTNWKIGNELGAWSRDDLKIATEQGKLSTRVTMDVLSTGDHFELEATTAMQKSNFTDAFLAELTRA
jgi:hypothetical protein